MINFKLNELIVTGVLPLGFSVGMQKNEIEMILGKHLDEPDIVTEDVYYYLVQMNEGAIWTLIFDKEHICFEAKLDFDENPFIDFGIQTEMGIEKITKETSFEKLVNILSYLKIDWCFDSKRTYLQTVCILLQNGLRIYFSFGDKEDNDFGLFSISALMESHKYMIL